jgi:hypothetical protein
MGPLLASHLRLGLLLATRGRRQRVPGRSAVTSLNGSEPEQFDDADDLFANLPGLARWARGERRRSTFLFLFITVIALTGGGLLQRQSASLADSQRMDRVRAEAICEDLTDNAKRFNDLIDTIALRVRQNTDLTDKQKAQAIELYTAAKQTLPVCVPPREGN